jgi:hypothetical protein
MSSENRTAIGCGCTVVLLLITSLVFQIALGGLWRTEFTWNPPAPAAAASQGAQVPFEVKLNAHHWLLGLVKGEQPNTQQAISGHVRPGDQLKELKVVFRHSFVDNLLAGVTLGIYTPVTVEVQGVVVQAAPPGR